MSDIVERLRNQSILDVWHPMMLEAAAEILRLRAENEKLRAENETHKEIAVRETMNVATLRAALKPFASVEPDEFEYAPSIFKNDHIRAAAAALKETE